MPGTIVTVEEYPGQGYWEAVVEARDAQGNTRVLRPRGKDWDEIWLKANEAYRSIVSPPETVNEKPEAAQIAVPVAEDDPAEFPQVTLAGEPSEVANAASRSALNERQRFRR